MDITVECNQIGNESGNEKIQNVELEEIRCRLREAKLAYREKQRQLLKKKIRLVEDVQPVGNINTDELLKLAQTIKRKNQITCEVLKAIMNTLLSNKKNIQVFLSVDGSLQALLRALSSQNENYQLLAARCICNLALGNGKLTLQVLKASDSYLFAHLDGKNCYLKEACAIAVGNFSRHGSKHIHLLLAQGFLPKIVQLLNSADDVLESSLIYALTQFVYHGFDILSVKNMQNALQAIIPIFQRSSFLVVFLMSVFSANKSCHEIMYHHKIHIQALQHLLISIKDEENEAVYYLRIICNCVCQESNMMVKELVEDHSHTLKECVKHLLESSKDYLKKECLILLGNLVNHPVHTFSNFGTELMNENSEAIVNIVKKEREDNLLTSEMILLNDE